MRLFISLLLFSFSAMATEWRDLQVLEQYRLRQSFQLPQVERSRSLLDFSKGDQVLLKEIMALDGIGVMLYIFKYVPCPGPAMETEMEIIPVQETSPVVEVGAQLESGCELNVYIEIKDLFTKSFVE